MIFYGDAPQRVDPCDALAALATELRTVRAMPQDLARHGHLVAILIDAGSLAQGLTDAEFLDAGADHPSPLRDAAMCLVLRLAEAVRSSWAEGFRVPSAAWTACEAALAALRRAALPGAVTLKTAEGFAFYALYPELYLSAAGALAAEDWCVIGIRSIGLPLSALVAAQCGAPSPITLRPVGHPFARTLALSRPLKERIARHTGPFAIVDEGPGLSGSSFAAVMTVLDEAGVAPERQHLFPSHAGDPGPHAAPALRRRWRHAIRHTAPFEAVILDAPAPHMRLDAWFADVLGPATAPLRDISGGAWRAVRFPDPAAWPPANPWLERRKFLLTTESGTWLLKFIGLGAHGMRAFGRATRLAEGGFVNAPIAFRHGFVAEPWRADLRPLDSATMDRAAFVAHLGRYLAFRAAHCPALPHQGATPDALLDMMRHNTEEALGPGAARRLDSWTARVPHLASALRRVETDNRLHAWEWMGDGGHWLKTDAVDHAFAHDLVGCQDIAWDIAGAIVEFNLSPSEADALVGAVARATRVDDAMLAFYQLAYPAFQLGAWEIARAQSDTAHAAQVEAQRGVHEARLRAALERTVMG